MIVFAVLALLCGFLFWKMPGSFLPEEDQGYALAHRAAAVGRHRAPHQ
jgi:multidrug efflux pump